MSLLDIVVFSCLILFLLLIGLTKKVRTESTYLFAGRQTGFLALTATLVMTEFNSATLISFSAFGYEVGLWALTLPCIFLFGLLFYGLTVAKKWKAYNGTSVAGFFTKRYGRSVGVFASLLLLIAMLGFSAAYVKSLTLIFAPLFPSLSYWILSALLVSVILTITLRGGLIAIIRTDMASFVLILLFFPFLALALWQRPDIPLPGREVLSLRFLVSLTLLTMFTYILAPWYGQKIFAAKSGRTAFWAVITAAVLVCLLYGAAIIATASFRYRGLTASSPDQALPTLIHECLPAGVRGFAFALLFVTSATTLTGVWSAMTAMWVGDFLKTPPHSSRRSLLITALFAFGSYFLANTLVDRVFDKLILANIPIAALSFGVLAGFYWKRASLPGVICSIVMGCLCGVGSYVIFGEAGGYTWYWAIYGIPLILLAGIVGSLCLSPSAQTSRDSAQPHHG